MKKWLSIGSFLLGMLVFSYAEVLTLVSSSAQWKYDKGTKEPSTSIGTWRTIAFDDSNWSSAAAPFYYGGNITQGTRLSDMRYNYTSVYLRKTFSPPSGSYEKLSLRALCDDGFILWINGEEVLRFNVSPGEKTFDEVASTVVGTASWQTHDLSAYNHLLRAGEVNVVAVHAFNASRTTSGDFAIDVELTADQTLDLLSPAVSRVSPIVNSVVSDPLRLTVYFSEPVSGVTATDVLCNDIPATEVEEITSSQYLFKFPKFDIEGPVTLKWSPAAEIKDNSPNNNPFVPPTESWGYTLSTSIPDSEVIINEFLASNTTGLQTKAGERADWLELHNISNTTADISGWYLTDSRNNLTLWQFPPRTTIPPQGYLIVFCNSWTGDPQINGEYLANFSLSKSGEYLALVKDDGTTIAHEFHPVYPPQYSNISFGNGLYYPTPTPGKKNGEGFLEPVGEVTFSESRGYKSAPFTLSMDSTTDGASIYYTLDGTIPTTSSTPYTQPLSISKITYIRAIATKPGHIDSIVSTRTWLFLEEALAQRSSVPAGWPANNTVNNHRMVYGMRQDIVNNPKYRDGIREGMTNIGTISMVTDLKNLFNSSTGIYVNPGGDGITWERPASLELIDPSGGEEFQLESGIRIRGGFSRSGSNPKHSFRLFFRSEYGGKLNFPLFGNEGASEFSKVDLRTSQNYAWSYLAGNPPEYNTFIRETFTRDSQRDVGMPYTRSRYYHLFINGQYWGLYQTQERSEADFAETYLGGDDNDWDCVKSGAVASDGTIDAFSKLFQIAVQEGFSGAYRTNYNRIKGLNPDGTPNPKLPQYVDEENLIQFVLNYFFTADPDSPIGLGGNSPNNLYGLYNRVNPTGFSWYRHDAEHSMGAWRNSGVSTAYDMTARGWAMNSIGTFTPVRLHQKLMDHPDYKMRFIDLYQQTYLGKNGAMSTRSNLFRWNARQNEVDKAIYAESARWTWDSGMTYEHWLAECDWVKNNFLSLRMGYLTSHLKNRGWYPKVALPTFSQSGGELLQDTQIYLAGGGTVYYTLDGSDPRLPGGELKGDALKLEPSYSEERVLVNKGSEWDYYDLGDTPDREGTAYWYQSAHSHDGWSQGMARFGFGDKQVQTEISRYKNDGTTPLVTAYFSKRFEVFSAITIPELLLELNCDDGAIVYLNGYRIVDQNMPSTYLTADLLANSDVSGVAEDEYTSYQIDSKYLVDGTNTISVEIHQASLESDDLYFDLELKALGGYSGGSSEGVVMVSPGSVVKARSLSDDGEWSAISVADFTVFSKDTDLKVTEIMYAPETPAWAEEQGWTRDDFAWIELQNTGRGILKMDGFSFVEGINYTFPALTLESGEYVVLAKNLQAFSTLYDTNGIILLDNYSGNLARKGETVTLYSPKGENILSFTYSNEWYPDTDQKGYSLNIVDIEAPTPLWSTAENWKVSATLGGSPGSDDGGIIEPPALSTISPGEGGLLTLNTGDSVAFSVTSTGSAPVRYQWYKDDVALPGATSIRYTINNLTPLHAGVYTVTATNRAGSVTSEELNLTVVFELKLSSITISGNSSVTEGKTAMYTCVANYNDDSSKQVTPDWSASPAQFATIDANGLLSALAEGEVNVTALYEEGGISKTIAKVVTIASSIIPPTFLSQPVSQTIREGEPVTLSVSVQGSEPLVFEWNKNGVIVEGAHSSSYTIDSIAPSDAGTYTLTVTNSKGSVTSQPAYLKVITGSGLQLMFDFQFNEGTGRNTADSVNGIVADLGDSVSDDKPFFTTQSPSGKPGDYAALLQDSSWLLGWFETEPLDLSESFTWESWIWMNPDSEGYRDLIRLGGTLKFGFGESDDVFQATFLNVADVNSTILVPRGDWVHIACSWEPNVGFRFFQNGVASGMVQSTAFPVNYRNASLSIGATETGECPFRGRMDRVRLHKGLLDASELDSYPINPKPVTENTIISYDFNSTILPFASDGIFSIPLYNEDNSTTNPNAVNWSNSTPTRDQNWPGSENDYSLYIDNSTVQGSTTHKIIFPTENLVFEDQSDPSFSMEAWIKGFERRASKQVFLQILGSPTGGVPRIAFAVSSDLTVYMTTMGIRDIDTGVPVPEDGKWHHIACAYDHSAQKIYTYVDGELKGELDYGQGVSFSPYQADVRGCIGSECSGGNHTTGYVDRIRVFKGVLLPRDLDYHDYSQVIVAPVITLQPESKTVDEGEDAVFSVAATGTEPLTYQWHKDNVAINGAVSSSYTVQDTVLDDSGEYVVTVSNAGGSVSSQTATLLVKSHVTIFTVQANDVARVYKAPNPAFTYTILNSEGEDVTSTISGKPTLSTTALLGSPAGTYPIVPTRGTLPSSNQYQYVRGTLTINKAKPEITWITPASILYGTPLSAVQLNAVANVPGLFEYTPPTGTILDVGLHELHVLLTPTEINNYEIAEKIVSLSVDLLHTLTLNPESQLVASGGGEFNIQVSSTTPWVATVPEGEDWIQITNVESDPSNKGLISYKVLENTRPELRQAVIRVQSGELSFIFSEHLLTQEPAQQEQPVVSFKIEGNSLLLTFTGNLYESEDMLSWTLIEGAKLNHTVDISSSKNKYYRSAIE